METLALYAMDQLFDLAVALDDLMNARLTRTGLTPARAEVLWVLYRRGPLTQKELSGILNCTPRNVTGLIDVLIGGGFVDRVPHPADRRAVQVSLSARGRALLAEWDADRTHSHILDGISAAELTGFTDILARVLTNLRS
jgi:DNA-binding MarR family transcriptional regulator